MAFPADSEYKTGGSSSKTVMGHWPIESSNLSLSATHRKTRTATCGAHRERRRRPSTESCALALPGVSKSIGTGRAR